MFICREIKARFSRGRSGGSHFRREDPLNTETYFHLFSTLAYILFIPIFSFSPAPDTSTGESVRHPPGKRHRRRSTRHSDTTRALHCVPEINNRSTVLLRTSPFHLAQVLSVLDLRLRRQSSLTESRLSLIHGMMPSYLPSYSTVPFPNQKVLDLDEKKQKFE
jgi:hypothetical protein